jgi:CRP-like cAMP-binding protein/anti-anti-sigma regulatory factor
LLLVIAVAAVTVIFGLVPAVVTGLVLSMALFIAVMNVSLVRSVTTGETRASRRIYPPDHATLLRVEGHKIKLIELDGALFFGTADRLGARVASEAEGARYLILDLRRVTMIDASGALMLERLSRRLRQAGTRMLLAHISATHPLGRALLGAGVFNEKHHPDWFTDTDRALEWAERQLLSQAGLNAPQKSIELGEFALMAGLSPVELQFMKPYLDRQLFPARAPLFREGERGDRLYLLARGAVSIVATDPSSKDLHRRVVTLAPGVMFGEAAVLEEGLRYATAIAEEESVTYSLSRSNLEAIRAVNPDLYQRLLLNMLEHLSGMLRMTAGVVRETSDSVY